MSSVRAKFSKTRKGSGVPASREILYTNV
jgi:hypothetical protein